MEQLVSEFLAHFVNEATRRAYAADLQRFQQVTNMPLSRFWQISQAVAVWQNFCRVLSDRHKQPRTIRTDYAESAGGCCGALL